MGKGRLEAFSDGVLAIIITIMVLELKVPHGSDLSVLMPLVPVFFSYVLSFVYVGIYWNNHHHMLHTTQQATGMVLLANLHLLFWLSILPFATGWMGENHFATMPTLLYGAVLLAAAFAFQILQWALIKSQGADSLLLSAVGRDCKGKLSIFFYLLAIMLTFWKPWLAQLLYAGVALIWIVPDRRIEKILLGRDV